MPQLLRLHALEPVFLNKDATATRSPCTATKSSPTSLQLENQPTHSNKDTAQSKHLKKKEEEGKEKQGRREGRK